MDRRLRARQAPFRLRGEFPDDDLPWRIEWIGGLGYNTSVPSEPRIDGLFLKNHLPRPPNGLKSKLPCPTNDYFGQQ